MLRAIDAQGTRFEISRVQTLVGAGLCAETPSLFASFGASRVLAAPIV